MNYLKTLAVATPLTISAFTLTGCFCDHNHSSCEEQTNFENDNSSMQTQQQYQTDFENYSMSTQQERQTFDKNDSSKTTQQVQSVYRKPNIPRISSNVIQYRNLSGKVVNVKVVDNATISLYKAIQKYSNVNSPDINDIGGFYADVESNISKVQLDESSDWGVKSRIYDVTSQAVVALRHLQCSTMFNKLFDIFTSPKSEGGENITVNEYTKMMDAWSSTGIKSNR